LELILLGRFECLLPSGTRISLSMRKAEVLLAYLALTPGLRHPRERLINLLWSDRGEEQARNSLRQCLSAIKKSLGDVADMVLQVDRTTVSLIPELIDIDVHEFERLATEGDYESLTTAADLYQGEFLEGISIRDAACQEWLDSERARFKRQFIEILANLAETQLVSHDFGHAIKSAERLVKQDPLGESGWRLLMRAYSDNGDRSHALQTFKRCQQALRDEIDVEPESTTIELRDQIAGGETKPVLEPTPLSKKSPIGSPASTDHSIAVLPFDNLSGDPEQEYFSDGITDSIILNLSLFPGLQVKSRNSSFAFKQQIKSLGEISTELNVDYIVEGSIRKSEQHVRITVQLIDAAGGNQIWGKRYDANLSDLFTLEEELSRSIAVTVTGQIESELQRIAIAKGADGQQAYDLLLSGTYHAQRFTRQDNVISIEKLNECLVQDPDNVRAHVMIYGSHNMDYLGRWTEDYQASFRKSEEHILRALELDPGSSLVHAFYGEFLTFNGELDKAAAHLDKALEINPNNPDALALRALNLESLGEFEASLRAAEHALSLDPYHPWAEWELAVAQYLCGRYEAALGTIAKLRASPGFIRVFIVASNIKLDRIDRARQALQELMRECRETMLSMPQTLDEWFQYTRENYPSSDPQINQDLIDCLVQAGLKDETAANPTHSHSDDHSIAVLPFDNLSGDPAQEYFSDGITESIILNLSLFPGLNVKSRNSSFAFKQQIKSPGEISKELEVDYLVEGSIRKTDERVRVTVQLIEAKSGNQVWGKRYDAEIEDLFDLEEDLSRTIATTVTGQIESDLQRIAITKGAAHQQAYDLLLAGTYHTNKGNAQDTLTAIEKLNQCLTLDPDNVFAHTELFWCHDINVIDRWVEDIEQARILADKHIHTAVSLDPGLSVVQVAYADYLAYRFRYDEAEQQLLQALEKNPNDAEAIAMQAVNLSLQGKAQAALEKAELALRLDPYHAWARWIKAESQYFSDRFEDCLTTIASTGNAPGFIQLYNVAANIKLDRLENAQKALAAFLQFCRQNMLSMPKTIPQWLDYYRDNAPFADPATNQEIIDCLLQAGLEDELASTATSVDASDQSTILVLPFSNLSGDPEQEYFSDGITESIIVNLGTVNGLKVKSIHASFAFKDSASSLDEIAAELGVQYIVEGSIRKFGDKVRITAQLVDTASGNQVWGKRFDYDLEDLFTLEEELSLTIAGTVSGRVDKESQLLAMRKPAKDMKSYDYVLRAYHHLSHFNAKDIKTGIELFEKCLALDPDNAEAHASLGSAYLIQLFENCAEDRARTRELMQQHLQRALELDPDNAGTHAFMAEALIYLKDFERGGAHARKAVELNPTLPDGYAMMAYYSMANREYDQAMKYVEQSIQIDPFHPYIGWNAGEIHREAGNYERAIEIFRALPHLPVSVHAQIAACLSGLGRLDEARNEMRQYLALAREQMISIPADEAEWFRFWEETMPYRYKEDTDRYFDQLSQAGLCDQPETESDVIPSIAVLPFENMSGDPEQEYFSDGITAGVILSLGMFKGLSVKSQRSSFAFKNSVQSSSEIGEALGVDYLVEGSIRKSDTKVRISAQLVEAAGGNQVWGRQYNAEAEDVLKLEQELGQTIAATISGRVGHTLQQSAVRKPARDLKSYDLYLRGLFHFGKFTPEDLAIAVEQFEQCIKIDPDNAEAHMQLGMTHQIHGYENWTENREESNRLSEYHLRKAAELAPDNAWVHAYLSEGLLTQDFDQAEYHADKAIELNPNLPESYAAKAQVTMLSRRYDEALECARLCVQLDPYNSGAAWAAGEAYLVCGEYEKSVKTFRSIETPPNTVRAQIAAGLAGMGQMELAHKEMRLFLDNARKNMPNYPSSVEEWRQIWREYLVFQFNEDSENYVDLLLKAGLCDDLAELGDAIPSIAVLPFENMSGDSEQGHFSDGITADLISTLFKFRHLRTVSYYSTQQYKSQKASIAEIAAQQRVRYILRGSVRKSGDRIRVNVELIDSSNEQILWSERFDRDLHDMFSVQDEITRSIALTMKVQLDDGDMALHRSKGATSIKAWELSLIAADLQNSHVRQNIHDSRAMAKEAIEIDPEYAFAWVTLAWVYWEEAYDGWSNSMEDSIAEAEKANLQARSLEPDYGEAWIQAGMIHLMKHEFGESIAACLKAIEFEPGNADIHALTAFAYIVRGEYEQARHHDQIAARLCPVRPGWYYVVSGLIEQHTGNPKKAVELYRRGREVEPDSPISRFYLIDVEMELGNEADARRLAHELKELDKSVSARGHVHAYSYDAGQRERFRANLAKFDLA